jgi:hypothetical protein
MQNLGSQIRQILPQLWFQFKFSAWHIAVRYDLLTAHVRMTSLRATTISGLVFTTNCHISTLLHFSQTNAKLAVRSTLEPSFSSLNGGILRKWAQLSIGDLDPDQYGSGFGKIRILEIAVAVCGAIFSLRVKLESEFGEIRRIWEPDFTSIDALL